MMANLAGAALLPTAPSQLRAMSAKSPRVASAGLPKRVSKRLAAATQTARSLPRTLAADDVGADANSAPLSQPPPPSPAALVTPTVVGPSERRAAPAKSPRAVLPGPPVRMGEVMSSLPLGSSTVPAPEDRVRSLSRNQTGRPSSAWTGPPIRASKRLAARREAAPHHQGAAVLGVAKAVLLPPGVASDVGPVPQADQAIQAAVPALKKRRQTTVTPATRTAKAPNTGRRDSPRALRSVGNTGRELGRTPGFLSDSQRAARLAAAVTHLQQVAPQVARLLTAPGAFTPPWDVPLVPPHHYTPFRRVPLFDALTRTILYQQVNGATAGVMYARLGAMLYPNVPVDTAGTEGSLDYPPLTAEGVLNLGIDRVRGVGVSGVKARYILSAAEACVHDGLDARLELLDDEEVNAALCALPGVGTWTAAMVRMFCFEQPDVLPVGDLTLRRVAAALWGKPAAAASQAECAAGRVKASVEHAAPFSGKAPAKAQSKTRDDARVKTVSLASEAAVSAQGPANTTKVTAFQPPLMTNEDLERLLEVCRPYRSYAAWALWGVTDECAFLPVGGVLQRLAY